MTTTLDVWIYLLLLLATVDLAVIGQCPEACDCKDCYDKDGAALVGGDHSCKMACESESPAASLTQVPQGIPPHVIQIDLSGNALTHIPREAFADLKLLQKLDLSSNQIKSIEPRAFKGLQSLTKLVLSGNGLKTINASLFEGMPNLEKLELAGNELESVPEGTFDVLPALQKVDFQSQRLMCDCRLQWVVKWQRSKKVRIRDSTACSEPPEHRGKPLRELKRKQFICDESIELPYFSLSPATSQVVFEGDRLPLECRASVPDTPAHMMWLRGVQPVLANYSQGIVIRQTIAPDHSMLLQSLTIEHLQEAHSGVWTCFIQTSRGNASKSVNIIVMSLKETYCPEVVKVTSRGAFSWPKTVSRIKMTLPCTTGAAASYSGDSPASATYRCTVEGTWTELDDTQCGYISEVTRKLEEYSTELKNITAILPMLRSLVSGLADKMDVVYIARIMEKLSKQVKDNEQVADFLLNTASSLMNVDDDILGAAQAEDNSCAKVVKVLDAMPKELLWEAKSVSKHTDNIAVAAKEVYSKNFTGLTCVVWRYSDINKAGVKNVYHGDSLRCTPGVINDTMTPKGMEVEASIYIPPDIFRSVRCLYPICSESDSFHIQIVAYKNAKLFPVVRAPDYPYDESSWVHTQTPTVVPKVVSSVMSANIAGVTVENTSSPIITRLRVPPISMDTTGGRHGVYWDFNANDGRGSWLRRGCSVSEKKGIATVNCNHLTHFGVSEDVTVIQKYAYEPLASWLGRLFTMSPAVYGGSVILVLCAMTVLITYISGHRYILMPKKSKHAIGNICLCLLLLCLTFTLGIHISQPIIACRVVGLAIHYFSLAQLFWIAILAFTMYKKFVKLVRPPPPPTDTLEEPPPPRSAITCYLIGWGISVIICGISGAINWMQYAGHSDYCFLPLNAALLTLFAPAAVLILVILILFLCILCVVRGRGSSDGRRRFGPHDEPETEELQVHAEPNEADGPAEDLLTTVATAAGTTGDIHSRTVTPTNLDHESAELSASKIDLEHRPVNQLRGVALLTFLYLVCWTCGALTIALPFTFPHQEIVFNYLYGISAFVLGIFVLVFYCVSRRDCREAWRQCCNKPPKDDCTKLEEEESIAPAAMTLQQLSHIRNNGHVQSASSLSSNKSNTISSFNPALYTNLHRPSKVNLVPSQTSDPSFTSLQHDVPIFYNPRQNGIAKKYWEKKHKRNLLSSHLNKDLTGDSGHSSNTENGRHGGMIYDGGRRLSYHGNSSDANTNKSQDIQIPPGGHNGVILDPRVGPYPHNPEQLQNMYNSLSRRQQLLQHQPQQHQQPMTIDPITGAPMLITPIDRHYPPHSLLGAPSPPIHTQSPPSPLPPVLEDSNFIPGQSCPSSVAAMSTAPALFNPTQYLLGLAPYNCDKSRLIAPGVDKTVPPQCNNFHQSAQPVPHEYMQRNGSVPRLRDFDGQSAISQTPTDTSLKSPPLPLSNHLPDRITPISKQNGDVKRDRAPKSETEVSDTDPFVKEIKQRIPQNVSNKPLPQTAALRQMNGSILTSNSDRSSKSPSPFQDLPRDRPCSGTSQDGKGSSGGDSSARSKTSRTQSEPATTVASSRGHTPPHGMPKGGSKSWDESQGDIRKKGPAYVYVNHKYKDRVLQKLLRQNQESGSSLVDSGVSWLPRSVSAYDQVITTETDTLVEETSSSSDADSDIDDVWVVKSRSRRRKKSSQETSV